MPVVILASAGDNQVLQVHPCLSDQVGLFIVVEDRHLQFIVVRRLMYSETQFVVPAVGEISFVQERW
jgi:hypothetical protein